MLQIRTVAVAVIILIALPDGIKDLPNSVQFDVGYRFPNSNKEDNKSRIILVAKSCWSKFVDMPLKPKVAYFLLICLKLAS
jgi:hypothetical protein